MIIHHNLKDLREYGIEWLTGEACHYGMRILCDLTVPGLRLVTRFFGLLPAEIPHGRLSAEEAAEQLGDDLQPTLVQLRELWPKASPFFAIKFAPTGFAENWNSRGVASIMLPWEISLPLLAFALLQRPGVRCVALWPSMVVGIEQADVSEERSQYDVLEDLKRFYPGFIRTYGPLVGHPHEGDRNVHAMSGRAT